jgi:hypothetical protein
VPAGGTVTWEGKFSPGLAPGDEKLPEGAPETIELRVVVHGSDGTPHVSTLRKTSVGAEVLDRRFALDLPLADGRPLAAEPRRAGALARRAVGQLVSISAGKGEGSRAVPLALLLASLGHREGAKAIVNVLGIPGLATQQGPLLRALGLLGGPEASRVILEALSTAGDDGRGPGLFADAAVAAGDAGAKEATPIIVARLAKTPLGASRASLVVGGLDALARLGGREAERAAVDILDRALVPAPRGTDESSPARRSLSANAAWALCRLKAGRALATAVARPDLASAAPYDAAVRHAATLATRVGDACDAIPRRPMP